MSGNTKEQFLVAATRLFATKGFYGASIANIADALGLTKQALLHHFGSKEKLYGEVLQRISNRMVTDIVAAPADDVSDPGSQLENALMALCRNGLKDPETTQLIMRELLDNKQRAEQAGTWYLKPFLEGLITLVRKEPGHEDKSDAQALALAYQLLGAMNYFLVSEPTLQQMFGETHYTEMKTRYPDEYRSLIRARLAVST